MDEALLGRLVVLTGAGLSTDSGIPDYRGPQAPTRTPMTYQDFVSGPEAQRRYWARAHLGWARMRSAEPNAGHRALARLEHTGAIELLITQNVDGLHERAGSRSLVALHGRISQVVCLDCRDETSRDRTQVRMAALNPRYAERHSTVTVRPDGDVDLEQTDGFVVPSCDSCGGRLKPDVVFFGENVPKDRVARCYAALEEADALLVAGSSLSVMSGLRFVRRAAALAKPVVILNRGATRGDPLATHRIDAGCSEFLVSLAAERQRVVSGAMAW